MKKFLTAAGISLIALSSTANAADLDYERQLGLIVSGVVDKWAGVQLFDSGSVCFDVCYDDVDLESYGDPTVFATGGEGLLSLPLTNNLSIQNDFKYEYNTQATDSVSSSVGPRYWYQGAVHVSARDPMLGLLGLFAGLGGASHGAPIFSRQDYRFVGGEGQFYLDSATVYVQGGYLDLDLRGLCEGCALLLPAVSHDDGVFGRGVVRWFPTADSRLQLEATYLRLSGSVFSDPDPSDTDVWSWKARYDFNLDVIPVLGPLPVFVAYRGTLRDDCIRGFDGSSADLTDHTFMVGTSYSFNGDRLTIDRQGATADTPDIGNMSGCSSLSDAPF
jgi:hypothetical protein